jgi:hypothetical protein
MKLYFTLLLVVFSISFSFAQNFDATQPIFTSDNSNCLQGIKQKVVNVLYNWQRPGLNANDLGKYIGALAINPNSPSKVFFTENSTGSNKLYMYDRATDTETYLNQMFTGAGQGANAIPTPNISGEDVFGITMMTIDKNLNIGYALSRNNVLYSFQTTSPYAITNLGVVQNAAINPVAFSANKGGGLMVAYTSTLVALINILQMDGTYKYYFYEINPQDMKARLSKQTNFDFFGFSDNTMFSSGVCAVGDGTIFASIYNGTESGIYKYNVTTNTFVHEFSTLSQAVGDMTGTGEVKATSNILAINHTNITATFNSTTNKTTLNFSNNANAQSATIQASANGVDFTNITSVNLNNTLNNSVVINAQQVSHPNKLQYYRIVTKYTNQTIAYSTIVLVNETTNSIKNVAISTYPNPTTDVLNISFNKATIINAGALLNADGRIVANLPLNNLNAISSMQITLSKYIKTKGLYYIKLLTNEGPITKPFNLN